MSAKDPPNLRRWLGWGVKKAGKQGYRRQEHCLIIVCNFCQVKSPKAEICSLVLVDRSLVCLQSLASTCS